ncbi:MAG: hypothetical protein JXC33_14030, partial [Deltaproteobacteria bacterium]|nr:hypothetical protein [Deltaproteobacteria bacterium]MBN2640900.1 hypothetical protein [Victivallales bacterium]
AVSKNHCSLTCNIYRHIQFKTGVSGWTLDRMNNIPLFIRVDDVIDLDYRLNRIIDEMMCLQIPVLASVIPSQITSYCAKWLSRKRESFPEMIEIGQHGYRHTNYLRGSLHGEFCRTRNYEKQREDLIAGKNIMDNLEKFCNKHQS